MRNEYVAGKLRFNASKCADEVVHSLQRTEDIKFSPSGNRLAVASYLSNTISIFDVSITGSKNSKQVDLINAAIISSSDLKHPHGLDFVDEEKILVTNREGLVHLFEVPINISGQLELKPSGVMKSDYISTPGSIVVCKKEKNLYEALICNSFVDRVTRHQFHLEKGLSTDSSEILSKKWIALPDSVAVSRDSRWIAVSSHDTHAIFVYRYDRPLDPNFDPAGVLRSHYPHGLRFTSDNRFVFAASAGSPYVNIYETENADWRGVRAPVLSVRVLSNDDFFRGRHNLQEGGPKGIDINHSKGLLVTTCETQPLGFFDLATIQDACEKNLVYCRGRKLRFTPNSMAIRYELYRCRAMIRAVAGIRWILWKARPLSWALNKVRNRLNVGLMPKPY